MTETTSYVAFRGDARIATGTLTTILPAVLAHGPDGILIFDEQTGQQRDFDLRGTVEDILARVAPPPKKQGPGRPRLGVVSREVSLLPRHWEWLETQSTGASAAIRRLIDDARRTDNGATAQRQSQEALGRVLTAIGGNLPGFEESMRLLYAQRYDDLAQAVEPWPRDVRDYVRQRLAVIAGVA